MKRCGKCGLDKPFDDFHRDKNRGAQHWCKACRRAYDREYHASTRELRAVQKRLRRANGSAWGWSLKEGRPCQDCGGIFHPAAMQWDHRPGTTKRNEVSMMLASYSRETVLEEISKCDLVCANCHAVRTYERRNGT